jgi:DNA-binding CsgD family transcriptional regulator
VALRTTLPCYWTLANLRQSAATGRKCETVQACLDSMENRGLRTGITFAARGPRAGERSLICLSSSEAISRAIDDVLMADVLMLAICLHEFLSDYVQWPLVGEQEPERLSTIQIQILHGLMRGLSDRELAIERNLTTHGVDYHLRQLRRYFNARNRVELVRAALRTDTYCSVY